MFKLAVICMVFAAANAGLISSPVAVGVAQIGATSWQNNNQISVNPVVVKGVAPVAIARSPVVVSQGWNGGLGGLNGGIIGGGLVRSGWGNGGIIGSGLSSGVISGGLVRSGWGNGAIIGSGLNGGIIGSGLNGGIIGGGLVRGGWNGGW